MRISVALLCLMSISSTGLAEQASLSPKAVLSRCFGSSEDSSNINLCVTGLHKVPLNSVAQYVYDTCTLGDVIYPSCLKTGLEYAGSDEDSASLRALLLVSLADLELRESKSPFKNDDPFFRNQRIGPSFDEIVPKILQLAEQFPKDWEGFNDNLSYSGKTIYFSGAKGLRDEVTELDKLRAMLDAEACVGQCYMYSLNVSRFEGIRQSILLNALGKIVALKPELLNRKYW